MHGTQKKPRLGDEEPTEQPQPVHTDTEALAAAVCEKFYAKPPAAWVNAVAQPASSSSQPRAEYHSRLMTLSHELREQKAFKLLYL